MSGFILIKESKARTDQTPSTSGFVRELRTALRNRGVLKQENDFLVFQQDYRFSSPSTAASVLVGGSANGRTLWKTKEYKTLKEYQELQLSAQ